MQNDTRRVEYVGIIERFDTRDSRIEPRHQREVCEPQEHSVAERDVQLLVRMMPEETERHRRWACQMRVLKDVNLVVPVYEIMIDRRAEGRQHSSYEDDNANGKRPSWFWSGGSCF